MEIQATNKDGDRKSRTYSFLQHDTCNMCGAAASDSKNMGLRLDTSQGRRPRSKRGIAVSISKCNKCDLIYANPQPIPESIDDHYGLPPEAYWNSVSFEPVPGYIERELKVVKDLLGFEAGMKSIDIGLGLGKSASVMRKHGFDVSGIEPSEPFYNKAIELLGNEGNQFQHSSIEDAEFDENEYDFITFGAVLEHLYDPNEAIDRALKWLKPGGVIHAEIPNSRHFVTKILNTYFRMVGTSFVTNTSPMHVPYHLYEFSLDSFHLNGKNLGYEVAHHWVDVATIYNIPGFLHKPLRWWMERTNTGMQLCVFLRKV